MLSMAEQLVGIEGAEASAGCVVAVGSSRAPQAMKAVTASTNKVLTSVYRGVCWNRKNCRWQASLNNTGRYIYLGSYKTQEEAAAVFDRAALRLRGARARLNFTRSNYVDARTGELLPDPQMDRLLTEAANPELKPNKRARTMPSASAGMQPGVLPQLIQRSTGVSTQQRTDLLSPDMCMPFSASQAQLCTLPLTQPLTQGGLPIPHSSPVLQHHNMPASPQLQHGSSVSSMRQEMAVGAAVPELDSPAHVASAAAPLPAGHDTANLSARHVDCSHAVTHSPTAAAAAGAEGQHSRMIYSKVDLDSKHLCPATHETCVTLHTLPAGSCQPSMSIPSSGQDAFHWEDFKAAPAIHATNFTLVHTVASCQQQQQQPRQQQLVMVAPNRSFAMEKPMTPVKPIATVPASAASAQSKSAAGIFTDNVTTVQAAHQVQFQAIDSVQMSHHNVQPAQMVVPAASWRVISPCSTTGVSLLQSTAAGSMGSMAAESGTPLVAFSTAPGMCLQQLPAGQWAVPFAQQPTTGCIRLQAVGPVPAVLQQHSMAQQQQQQQGACHTMLHAAASLPSPLPMHYSDVKCQPCAADTQSSSACAAQLSNGQQVLLLVSQPSLLQQPPTHQRLLLHAVLPGNQQQTPHLQQYAQCASQHSSSVSLQQPFDTTGGTAPSMQTFVLPSYSSSTQPVAFERTPEPAVLHPPLSMHAHTATDAKPRPAPSILLTSCSPGTSMVDSNHVQLVASARGTPASAVTGAA